MRLYLALPSRWRASIGFPACGFNHFNQCVSEVGRGTTVSLWLLACQASREFAPAADLAHAKARGEPGLALLMDDDPDVRKVARRALLELGVAVIEAESGAEAMQILDQTSGIVLLLSDVVMPGGVDGRELAAHARQRCGVSRVVLMSGYAPELDRLIEVPILDKPFSTAQLAALIQADAM